MQKIVEGLIVVAGLAGLVHVATPKDQARTPPVEKVRALLSDPYVPPRPPLTQPPRTNGETPKKVDTIISRAK